MNKTKYIHILCITLLFSCIQIASAQTTIHGKLLSVDGSVIPKTVISVHQQTPRDIFGGIEDVYAGEDGSYQITLPEPGLYNLTFRGIYHQNATIPILIIDQDSVEMDLLLFPGIFNDGRYFGNEDYLEWIRVVGDFNDYELITGSPFRLNEDGSISAFIPVTSDTIRYQVRGLAYGRMGNIPLPIADEYNIRENRSFESVLYRDLPADSIEIRYIPGESIPYQRIIPTGDSTDWQGLSAYIRFHNESDRYWVEPIHLHQNMFISLIPVLDHDLKHGLTPSEQLHFAEKFSMERRNEYIADMMHRFRNTFYAPDTHPQQKATLSISYVSLLLHLEMVHRKQHVESLTISEMLNIGESSQGSPELNPFQDIQIDMEMIRQIPDLVVPTHPILARSQLLPRYLLNLTDNDPAFLNFFMDIAKYQPNEAAVERYATAFIQVYAHQYDSVEEMELYQLIVDRFGVGELARRSHEAFHLAHHQE